jgi:hypothetical protein
MPSHFTLRMQFGPHQDARLIAEQLLDLVRSAPVDEIMFFYFAEDMNDGHESIERIGEWIEHSRIYRRVLADAGVCSSLNPWHSILHVDRNRSLKPGQNWQTMVDQNGLAAKAQVCPLDEGWRTYFDETLRLYAKEGFRVVWIDDDFRFHNHAPLDWGGCFCELHVAEFNRRAGTKAGRREIVANVTAPGEPHPWRKIWLDMWDETQVALLAHWREILDAHDVRLGLMSSVPEVHSMEGRRWLEWWKAIGGGKPPVHRPHYWPYNNMLGESLPGCIATLDQNRAVQPDDVDSGPEVDSFQYGPWAKSFRQQGAQLALAHVLGSTRLNISMFDFLGNPPLDIPERMQFLRDWRPTCDWLADEFPMTLRSQGVGIPWSEDMSRKVHTNGSGRWQSLLVRSRSWANWLGACGHAFSMRPSPRVNALGGNVAWSYTDSEIHGWLSKGVIIDGPAASILVERGFGKLLGVRSARMVGQDEVLYSIENCLDDDFAVRAGAQISVNSCDCSATSLGAGVECPPTKMFQGELLSGSRVVSDLRSPTQNVVGHGLVVFENELGGRVAVVPLSVDNWAPMTLYRSVQLAKTLHWLDPANAHGWVEGGAWLVPQFLTDGKLWRGAVWNAGPDEIEEFVVCRPHGMPQPTRAIHVDARGRRREAVVQGDRIRLTRPLHEWEFVVLF